MLQKPQEPAFRVSNLSRVDTIKNCFSGSWLTSFGTVDPGSNLSRNAVKLRRF